MAQVEIESALPVRNGTESEETHLKISNNSGTFATPLVGAHDQVNVNANLQVGDADNAIANPAYVAPSTGANFTVSSTQLDIDDLQPGVGAGFDGVLVYGSDDGGTTPRTVLTDTAGRVATDSNLQVGNNDVTVSNPVPVSVVEAIPNSPKNGFSALNDSILNPTGNLGLEADEYACFEVGAGSDAGPLAGDYFNEIYASASGRIKVELYQADAGATIDSTFVTALRAGTAAGQVVVPPAYFIGFNSTANPDVWFHFENDLFIDDTATANAMYVVVTNLDNQPQSVYVHTGGFTP